MCLILIDEMRVFPEANQLRKRVEKLESALSACMATQTGLTTKIKDLVKDNSAAKAEIGKLTGNIEVLTQIMRQTGLLGMHTLPQQGFAAATPLQRQQYETPRSGVTADEMKGVLSGCLKELLATFDIRGMSPSQRAHQIETPQQRGLGFVDTPLQTPYTPGLFTTPSGSLQGMLATPIPQPRDTATASGLQAGHRYAEDPRNPLFGQDPRREQVTEEGLLRSTSHYSSPGQGHPSLEQTATGLLQMRQQQQFQR